MIDVVHTVSAAVPQASQIAQNDSSGASPSGVILVIVLLVAGVLLFRRYLMPTVSSMTTVVRQIVTTPAGRVAGVAGLVLLGILVLGGL